MFVQTRKRLLNLALLALCLSPTLGSTTAQAHMLWALPTNEAGQATPHQAILVLSEELEPDKSVTITNIGGTTMRGWVDGNEQTLPIALGEHAYQLNIPENAQATIAGACDYGVITRGDEPYRLGYYPKLQRGPVQQGKATPGQPVEFIAGGDGRFQFVHNGHPVANAEVHVWIPDAIVDALASTDENGWVTVDHQAPGLYGLWARVQVDEAGELDGQAYAFQRMYATYVFEQTGSASATQAANATQADPAAVALLEDARAHRATWHHFPGFEADLVYNQPGNIQTGTVRVDAQGQATFTGIDASKTRSLARTFSSLVGHRVASEDGSNAPTPCVFAVADETHPQGQEVVLLGDAMGSSFRIKDQQIMQVNRQMGQGHFSINMLKNTTNAEGKYLPSTYTVSFWDGDNTLTRTNTYQQTWTRVGNFDLPATRFQITAAEGDNALTINSITLSNHQLLAPTQTPQADHEH